MSLETELYQALKSLVPGNHVYRDILPSDKSPTMWITFQQVGGPAINFLGSDRPSQKRARVQVNCWGMRRDEVNALARAVEDALVAEKADLSTDVLGAFVAVYEHDTRRYGTHQDFMLAYDD